MAEKTLLDWAERGARDFFFSEGWCGEHAETWNACFGNPIIKGEAGTVSVTHILMTAVVVLIIVGVCLAARAAYSQPREEAILPDEGISARNIIEAIFDFTLDTMASVMPREEAKRYFPLIIALTLFILIANLLGLIPGLTPPTQNFNTNIAMALSVFVIYNVVGLWEHGVAYLEEFISPASVRDLVGDSPGWGAYMAGAGFWLVLSGLFVIIEGVSHIFRPISLAVRLTGNMGGDHAVLGAFSNISEMVFGVPFAFPIPFLALGVIVSVVQTMVFALLSVAYIAMAVEEGH